MDKTEKRTIPPRGSSFENETIFIERFVVMRGLDYYLRQFHSGSAEFSRYDEKSKKWIYLYFPAPQKTA